MLHILLTILKIIGIILLVVLSLILIICACILFVPVRYGAYIRHKDSPELRVKVTYLLHAVSLQIIFRDKKLCKELRIFGFKTHFLDEKNKKSKKDKDKISDERSERSKNAISDDNGNQNESDIFDEVDVKKHNSFLNKMRRKWKRKQRKKAMQKQAKKAAKTSGNPEEDDYLGIFETERDTRDLDNVEVIESNFFQNAKRTADINDNGTVALTADREETTEDTKENAGKSIFSKIKFKIHQIIHKIKYQIVKICGTIKDVFEKIRTVRSKMADIRGMIEDEDNRLAFVFVKGQALKVLRHIRPRRIQGYIRFGFDDPYQTGRILGLIYAVLRRKPKRFGITPDFEQKILETDMQIKGRVQVYYLLIVAYRIYKNENFKKAFERRRKNGR